MTNEENELNIGSAEATEQVSITSIMSELESRSLTEVLMTLAPQERRSGHCISLYLSDMRDPIELWNHTLVTVGRRDKRQNIHPTIDLTDYHGVQLGVSRIHAQIIYEDAAFYVIDLGSKNSSWLNKTLLIPGQKTRLTHRDGLRLGSFMIQVGACQYPQINEPSSL